MLIRHKIIAGSVVLIVTVLGGGFHVLSSVKEARVELTDVTNYTSALAPRSQRVHLLLDELEATLASRNAKNATLIDAELTALFDRLSQRIAEWKQATRQVIVHSDLLAAGLRALAAQELAAITVVEESVSQLQQEASESRADSTRLAPALKFIHDRLSDLEENQRQQTAAQLQHLESHLVELSAQVIWSAVGLCLIAIGSGAWIAIISSRSVNRLIASTQRVAAGDFAPVKFDSTDEFAQLSRAFNEMAEKLNATTVVKSYVDRVLASMVNTLLILDRDDHITFANQSAIKLLGYSGDELAGKHIAALLGTSAESRTLTAQIREQGTIAEIEVNYLTRDGRQVAMAFSGSLLKEDGSLICVAHDITSRRIAEQEIERMHRELQQSSRQAGMAEVATGVLHNVGNVLNSLNVSATVISDRVLNSSTAKLTEIVRLLEEHSANLPEFFASKRGTLLATYLGKLHAQHVIERAEIGAEVKSLRKNIDHIREIVSMQQNYARIAGVAEKIPVVEIIEDAIQLNSGALVRHQVTLLREYEATPTLTLDKPKLLQILVNLIRNAKYACDESGKTEKRLILRTEQAGNFLKILVIDNGVGIPAENLDRIFNHGFTTRKEGHGFGLHSGALAAADLKGSLVAHSAGPGHGATFTLTLPLYSE